MSKSSKSAPLHPTWMKLYRDRHAELSQQVHQELRRPSSVPPVGRSAQRNQSQSRGTRVVAQMDGVGEVTRVAHNSRSGALRMVRPSTASGSGLRDLVAQVDLCRQQAGYWQTNKPYQPRGKLRAPRGQCREPCFSRKAVTNPQLPKKAVAELRRAVGGGQESGLRV